jgi:hypothetical protein
MIVFQIVFGDIPEIVQHCMESVKIYYPQVEALKFPKTENPVIDSNELMMERLGIYDDILFIDWDILLKRELTIIQDGKPTCEFYKGAPDYSMIYSPSKNFWIKLEEERLRRNISKTTYGWPRKLLRNSKVNAFVESEFTHYRGEAKWRQTD